MSKNFATNKLKMATIALVLMLTMVATLTALPVVNAHTPPWTVKTYAYLSVAPSPVGLGQTAFINMFVNLAPPTAGGTYLGVVIGDRWANFTITVTAPDHHQTVLGPFTSDATGGTYTTFVPDQLGNYSLVFNFPGMTLTGGPAVTRSRAASPEFIGDYFQPSSATTTVLVQQEKIVQYPSEPLPTGYWTRPINAMNDEWARLGGNWLGLAATTFHSTGNYNASGNFAPYTTAPNSPHIIWTRPMKFGGQLGGEPWVPGDQTSHFVSTSQYQPFYGPIILAGRLYYQERPGGASTPTGWNCIDIKTGQLIWHKNTTNPLVCGQILDYESINQYGAYAYLWAMDPTPAGVGASNRLYTYGMYDAWTGEWILDIINAPAPGTQTWPFSALMLDSRTCKGSLLGYYVNSTGTRRLCLWNSTWAIDKALVRADGTIGDPHVQWWNPGGIASNSQIPPMKYPQPGIPAAGYRTAINFTDGIVWTAPIPTNFTGTYANGRPISLSIQGSQSTPDVILMRYSSAGAPMQPGWFVDAAMSARDGRMLWGPINRTDVVEANTYTRTGPAGAGCYAYGDADTFTWTGFSLTTGEKLWGPITYPHNVWDRYGMNTQTAYGNLYVVGFGGYVNCIDYKTGAIKWTYFTGGSGYDTPYGVWPLWTFARVSIADGKIWVDEGHEYSPPTFRGAQGIMLDAYTGKQLWSVLGFYAEGPPAIADGVMVVDNAYDMQLYAFAPGRTATTITASPAVVTNGSSVLIRGTVTDQSPGQTCLGIPAAGTPAIGEAYMKPWMEYLYMQQPMPSNATGVPVQLQAVGSDGAITDIGTVRSDAFGNFEYKWTPTTTGTYKILATFAGSNSYYASYAETSAGVDPSPAPTYITTAAAAAPDNTPIFAGMTVAIVVVAILVVYTLYTVRKQKK
jgi:hypothetical protein